MLTFPAGSRRGTAYERGEARAASGAVASNRPSGAHRPPSRHRFPSAGDLETQQKPSATEAGGPPGGERRWWWRGAGAHWGLRLVCGDGAQPGPAAGQHATRLVPVPTTPRAGFALSRPRRMRLELWPTRWGRVSGEMMVLCLCAVAADTTGLRRTAPLAIIFLLLLAAA